jgi:hypothetical protein
MEHRCGQGNADGTSLRLRSRAAVGRSEAAGCRGADGACGGTSGDPAQAGCGGNASRAAPWRVCPRHAARQSRGGKRASSARRLTVQAVVNT